MKKTLYFLFLFGYCLACQQNTNERRLYQLETSNEAGIQAVIEIPAGTNDKIEYNLARKGFEIDSINGKARVINFLPYPGNYGFIPSTYVHPEQGGDGDALDVLVLSPSVPTGTVMNILPVAVLLLKDRGEIDSKIIAVPLDSTQRSIQIATFTDLLIHHHMAKKILEDWFLSYKGVGQMELIAWEDERAAMKEIEKWTVAD
ncbi:MAG: inorganic diphosphatase [Bacteroidota bacterium]